MFANLWWDGSGCQASATLESDRKYEEDSVSLELVVLIKNER